MDIFYEESSIAQNATKGARRYRILHGLSLFAYTLGFFAVVLGISIVPIGTPWIGWGIFCLSFFAAGVLFWRVKLQFNVSYDYVFVSGELRISKVMNVNKRKLMARIDAADIIQMGDVDNTSFDRLKSDPMTKTVLCTSNSEAAKGKFFMYILANHDGKKLFILECKETLLVNILKFAKRSTLESDYISQEKKQAKA